MLPKLSCAELKSPGMVDSVMVGRIRATRVEESSGLEAIFKMASEWQRL